MDYQISWLMPLMLLCIIKCIIYFNILQLVICWVDLSAIVLYILAIFLSFGILLNRRLNIGALNYHWIYIFFYEIFVQLKAKEFQEIIFCLHVANLMFTASLNKNLTLIHYLYFF